MVILKKNLPEVKPVCTPRKTKKALADAWNIFPP